MVNTVEKFEELLELQFQEYDIQNADGNLLQEPPENASRTSVPEASRTKCSEKVPLLPASCSYAKPRKMIQSNFLILALKMMYLIQINLMWRTKKPPLVPVLPKRVIKLDSVNHRKILHCSGTLFDSCIHFIHINYSHLLK